MNLWPLMKVGSLVLVAGLQQACKPITVFEDGVDRLSFSWTGGTVFSDPLQVTTKQLHFDTGSLFGKDVVMEGQIHKKGEEDTHLILKDPEGRILIVLTQLENSYQILENGNVGSLRVLGRLERGKKGLPYLLAKAIKAGEDSNQTNRSSHSEGPTSVQ